MYIYLPSFIFYSIVQKINMCCVCVSQLIFLYEKVKKGRGG